MVKLQSLLLTKFKSKTSIEIVYIVTPKPKIVEEVLPDYTTNSKVFMHQVNISRYVYSTRGFCNININTWVQNSLKFLRQNNCF